MKRAIAIASASLAIALAATPASAATSFYQCGVNAPSGSSCISDTNNVLLTTATNVGGPGQAVGEGFIQPIGPGLTITTTETAGLNLDANGQATILGADGRLNNVTFNLTSGGYSRAEFNLNDIRNQDFDVVISVLLNGVVTQTSQSFSAEMNGSNRFGVDAGAGILTGLTINSTTGFGSLTQLRIAPAVAAVPEPGTWALMLLGFGAVGASLRRGRRSANGLPQLA